MSLAEPLGLIIAFLGLYFGMALAYIAPEELKPGKRYFKLLQKICFCLVPPMALFFELNILALAGVVVSAVLWFVDIKDTYKYPILAIFLGLSSGGMFLVNACLVIIYGMASGTLFTMKHKKSKLIVARDLLYKHVSFLIAGILTYLLTGLLPY